MESAEMGNYGLKTQNLGGAACVLQVGCLRLHFNALKQRSCFMSIVCLDVTPSQWPGGGTSKRATFPSWKKSKAAPDEKIISELTPFPLAGSGNGEKRSKRWHSLHLKSYSQCRRNRALLVQICRAWCREQQTLIAEPRARADARVQCNVILRKWCFILTVEATQKFRAKIAACSSRRSRKIACNYSSVSMFKQCCFPNGRRSFTPALEPLTFFSGTAVKTAFTANAKEPPCRAPILHLLIFSKYEHVIYFSDPFPVQM